MLLAEDDIEQYGDLALEIYDEMQWGGLLCPSSYQHQFSVLTGRFRYREVFWIDGCRSAGPWHDGSPPGIDPPDWTAGYVRYHRV